MRRVASPIGMYSNPKPKLDHEVDAMSKIVNHQLMKPAAYARRRGVTRQAVWAAIRDGRIACHGGLIDPEAADLQWERNSQRARFPAPAANAPADEDSFAHHRTRREAAEAELVEMRVRREAGQLMESSRVVHFITSSTVLLRTTLEELPAQIAPQLPLPREVQEQCRLLLAERIEDALTQLSKSFASIASAE
jgi:hypothetical protein